MNEVKKILLIQCKHNSKLGKNLNITVKREMKQNGDKIKNIKLHYIKYHNIQKKIHI